METIEIVIKATVTETRTEKLTVPAFRTDSGIYYKVNSESETVVFAGAHVVSLGRMDSYPYIPQNFWVAQPITEAEFRAAYEQVSVGFDKLVYNIAPKEGE